MNIDDILYPSPEFKNNYNEIVEHGEQHLAQHSIVIAGLVRNLEKELEKNITKLIAFGKKAKHYKIVLFENDSTDNTKEILSQLSKNNDNIIVRMETFNRKQFGQTRETERTEALAEYRNQLLNTIKEQYSDYDYVVVTDTDFVDFSLSGCYNSFGWLGRHPDVDAIAGNSFELKKVFSPDGPDSLWNYDSWAYRPSWWTYTLSSTFVNYDPMLWFGIWIPPVGSSIFAVNSAFGGMCIYKTKMFISGEYSGYDCEHVTFHYSLVKNNTTFKLYLNPSQVMLVKN